MSKGGRIISLFVFLTYICMIDTVNFLHITYFIIGVIEVILSTIIMFEQNLYPANVILNFYKKARREIHYKK